MKTPKQKQALKDKFNSKDGQNLIAELKDIRDKIEQEPSVQSVAPNIIYTGYVLKSWRDEIP